MLRKGALFAAGALIATIFCSCATTTTSTSRKTKADQLVVSVDDQRLVVLDNGKPLKSYPVSTSKFGLGSRAGSNHTPLGDMYVYQKIGGGARSGTVFKSRKPTGEVIRPNAPGRDPIVSRILWLEGKERNNANTKERTIYIHGTPEERSIGRPASYGCIRMKSSDVIDLYDRIGVGTGVHVKRSHLATREIPSTDRSLMVAAQMRERPARIDTFPTGGTEVLAAAAPQRSQQPAPRKRVESRPPPPRASKPIAPSEAKPVRRGAFTRL
jgi:lipoprotein-anchoring transpeptidase ErfK/SrfK